MKILINASNLVVGGALQVARSFLTEITTFEHGHKIKVVVSQEIFHTLPKGYECEIVSPSPSKIFSGTASRKKLSLIEEHFRPDVVLSIFGPTYWNPKTYHVCGFAESWVFSSNSYAWKTRKNFDGAIAKLKIFLKKLALIREGANGYILETQHMAEVIQKKFPGALVSVVNNNCGQPFFKKDKNSEYRPILPPKERDEYRVVTLSQFYPHKNLDLLPYVASELKKASPNLNAKFYLPLEIESGGWKIIFKEAVRLGVEAMIYTVGTVSPADAPLFYEKADLMLLPSVLECFSANYPEAMVSGVPIVTTDLPFAKSVCKEAALYFEPMNASDAAKKILKLYGDNELKRMLVLRGYERLKSFPTPRKKAQMYLKACEDTLSSQKVN